MIAKTKPAQVSDNLADFTRDRRILLLGAMAIVIGALSACIAAGLIKLIDLATNLAFFHRVSFADISPAENGMGAWVILVPAAGGLLIGLMARYGSEKIRGHGIPEALEAILIGRSRMDPKVAVLKPLSSALSIGTGGPFGSEGPIIMTGGAAGSLFAQAFHLSASERKTLLVAGAAGGMAAIFSTPVAAVLLAVELLLFEWRPRSFIPVAIAATVAGLLREALIGNGPIFLVPPHGELPATAICIALAGGLLAGLGSIVLTSLVYFFEDLFHKLPFHWMWWPALGGLAVGIGGWIDPRAFGVGYSSIHGLLLGQDLGGSLWMLLIVKTLVWSIALGSGTSGGVLAPLLIIGGTLGAIESHLIPHHDSGLWAMIGMAAMMGGTMRSPLTAMVFALELTHDIAALPALLAGCVAAHTVTVMLMRRSILTEKVARRGHHLTREYGVDPLQQMRVGEIMDTDMALIPSGQTVAELAATVSQGEPSLLRHQAFPIVDAEKRLAGIITRNDLRNALATDSHGRLTVLEAGKERVITVFPDDLVDSAVEKMIKNAVGRVIVVDRADSGRVVGYLGRSAILLTRMKRMDEEFLREPGWIFPLQNQKASAKSFSGKQA